MNEQEILDECCYEIKIIIETTILPSGVHLKETILSEIRDEIMEAMRKARKEALRGN